jgi:TatD DNase family protein
VTPLIDTHAHFGLDHGPDDALAQVDRALDAGICRIVAVGGSEGLNAGAVAVQTARSGRVLLALGFDRAQAKHMDGAAACVALAQQWATLKDTGVEPVALGEIGLDFHYDADTAEAQDALFRSQLRLAAEHALPVIVHSRDADPETLCALDECGSSVLRETARLGVLHCFTGEWAFAERVLKLGMYVSFSGIVTFRNADALREVARQVPLDRLLIETDCPYLTPIPLRGRPNEPAFVRHVAECLAEVRGISFDTVAAATSRNADRLFGVGDALT